MDKVKANAKGYADDDLPLEGIWLDITYMDGYADFSVNSTGFPDLGGYTDTLHENGQKMIVIVDAGISADDSENKYYAQASAGNKLIKSSLYPEKFNGALSTTVWPNHTVFLDFFDDDAAKIWEQGLSDLHQLVSYDGLWLDMNEICAFCDGECPDTIHNSTNTTSATPKKLRNDNESWYQSYDQDEDSTYYLPFIPGDDNFDFMAMSLNATHPSNNLREYDVHSLFGHVETKRTFDFMTGD